MPRLDPAVMAAEEVVRLLALEPLPHEGGFFRRTAESPHYLPTPTGERRRVYSVIYALFTPEQFSALHRLATDEIWCFHAGDPLESLRLYTDGRVEWVRLGLDVAAGERPHDIVGGGVWQGTRLVAGGRWALVTCTVAPEFRWEEFELGERRELARRFPGAQGDILALTRERR
jgi:uncharacterized protein